MNNPKDLKTHRKGRRSPGQKSCFSKYFTIPGGIVSEALRRSSLNRSTAYQHYGTDPDFKQAWDDVLECVADAIEAEIRFRAALPTIDGNGDTRVCERPSDAVLIHLHKHSEIRVRNRGRLRHVGNVSPDTIREAGLETGLTETQISHIEHQLLERYKTIPRH